VYIPGIYEKRPDLHFPVLYLEDGQNLHSYPECSGTLAKPPTR
jgi:predicted alpha/beta superfamily hydrolase